MTGPAPENASATSYLLSFITIEKRKYKPTLKKFSNKPFYSCIVELLLRNMLREHVVVCESQVLDLHLRLPWYHVYALVTSSVNL